MAEFIIAYMGGREPDTPEEGKQQREKWGAWLAGLGDAVVNPGTPISSSKVVAAEGVSDADPATRLTGFTVVKAASLEEALEMARECPFLEIGRLEVGEMMQMPG